MRAGRCLALLACTVLTACSVHPLPQDVLPYDTTDIVAKIRCEARDAVEDKAIAFLESDKSTRALGKDLANDRSKFKTFQTSSLHDLNKDIEADVEKYSKAAIAYEFTFDMTEDNNAIGEVDLLGLISGGTLKLGLNAGVDRSRQNVRHFQVTDTFGELVHAEIFCPSGGKGPNQVYPIAGSINIKEPIDQFINLNQFAHLSPLTGDKAPTFAEGLTFQTILSGSANPQVILSPVRSGVSGASATASVKRTDIHKLILGFSIPVEPAKAADNKPATRRRLLGRESLLAASVYAKTASELAALLAIEQFKQDEFYRTGNVRVPQ